MVRPFAVSTEAGFDEEGMWVIEAHLRFRCCAPPAVGCALLDKARLALLGQLTREALRGHALGARRMRVCMHCGGRVSEITLDARVLDPSVLH